MLTIIILIVCGLSLLALAAVVLYSNPKASLNRWLSVFMLGGFLWLLANLFANIFADDPEKYLFFSQWALAGAAILPSSFLLFCLAFVRKKIKNWLKFVLFLPSLVLLALVPTQYNVESIASDGFTLNTGPAYPLLIAVLVSYFTVGVVLLVKYYKKADEITRQQLSYMLFGFMLTAVPGILISGILPSLGNSKTAAYGPAVIIFFSLFTSIAIIRHQLFDIRFYVVRALAYSITLIGLGILYVAPGVYLITLLVDAELPLTSYILVVLAASILATNYYHVRQWFNKLSNRLFFRDSYEPSEVLSKLNKSLSSTININDMTRLSSAIFAAALRPETITFLLKHDNGLHIKGGTDTVFAKDELELLDQKLAKIKKNVTTITDLSESNPAREYFLGKSIYFIVRLSTNQEGRKDILGYILFGPRKSGIGYSINDTQTMTTASNTLAIAMQNALHFEEIQQFNVTLQGRVDEATRKYRATNEKLKKLDETKDEFISMASHQLRTPLTSVKGYLSMVLEGDVGKLNKQQEELLKQSYLSSQRMVNLIADLLNLSRLNTGKFVIDAHPIDLRDVVDSELMQLRETAKAKDITLSYDRPENFPILNIDENKIHQVVMNFVDNAIYYTPNGGSIIVNLRETPTAVEYTVTDTGIGVPRDVQRHLFTKFYRAENAKRARPDGTGLGLFMAKKVIIAQGGSIIFESEEGKGSTFGFRFNKSQVAVPREQVLAGSK